MPLSDEAVKPRRWFLTPELVQWRYMVACDQYFSPFFLFPYYAGASVLLRKEVEGRK